MLQTPQQLLMRYSVLVVLIYFISTIIGAYMPSTPQARIDPSRVVLIYDSSCTIDEDQNGVQDSLQLAQLYSAVREVPTSNIYGMNGSAVNIDTDDWQAVYDRMVVPFSAFLDSVGPQNIDILTTFWPLPPVVPLGINPFRNERSTPTGLDYVLQYTRLFVVTKEAASDWWYNALQPMNPYSDFSSGIEVQRPRFSHNIAKYYYPDESYVIPQNTENVYLVSRIDGPGGLAQKMNLIGNAMYADKYVNTDAFWGTTYVDTYGGSTDYNSILGLTYSIGGTTYNTTDGLCADTTTCDGAIALGGKFVKDLGLPFKWEVTEALIGSPAAKWSDDGQPASSCPNTMFYFGWFAFQTAYTVFDYLPGSYATDLDGASLGWTRYRDPSFGTTGGQALYHGATTASGALMEPSLPGHIKIWTAPIYLLRGYSWAEASNLAGMSGYSIIIGDPLYQPFADKQLVVDTDAPQLEDTPSVFFANKSGGVVVFNLKGIESAKLTLRYGVVSVFENSVQSMYYMKYFRQQFYSLRGSTTYKYRLDLVDPAGNKFISEVYTFTTPAQTPFSGTPEVIPGEILINHFDYGGSGITYRDLTGFPYGANGNRPETELQVAYYDDNFIFQTYSDEYMKYTLHVDTTGVYNYELMYDASNTEENINMEVLTYVDGHLITDRHPVSTDARMGNYQTVGSMTLSAGDHVFMIRFNCTANPNLKIASWYNAGFFYRMRFTLLNALTDNSAPTATVVSSDDTGDYYVENVQFGDDIGIAYVDVVINGETTKVYELPDGLLFPFHFSAYEVSSVTITAYDAAGQSSTPITKSYDVRTRPLAPTPPNTAPQSSFSPSSKTPSSAGTTPDGKSAVSSAALHRLSAALAFVLLAVL